jgi:hypothetical protein
MDLFNLHVCHLVRHSLAAREPEGTTRGNDIYPHNSEKFPKLSVCVVLMHENVYYAKGDAGPLDHTKNTRSIDIS